MKIDLDKLLELEAKEQPAPWKLEYGYDCVLINDEHTILSDFNFIEAMRNNIKELCTELKAAREVVEALRLYAKRENWIKGSDDKYGALACDYGHTATKALKKYDESRLLVNIEQKMG